MFSSFRIDSKSAAGQFSLFAAGHSLLIGLLPFYLPVLIWEHSNSLTVLCFFVALTGLGFVLSLAGWQRLRKRNAWRKIFSISFTLEIFLLMGMMWALAGDLSSAMEFVWIVLLALINGAYACFYWTTQRVLFNGFTASDNSGKHFGNFQMIAAIMLKIGIFTGGFLLEQDMFIWLFLASAATAILCYRMISSRDSELFEGNFSHKQQLSLSGKTKLVFLIDGLFLYLESYFWTLTLFLVLKESFAALGAVVVLLTIMLTIVFWLIRKYIDRYNLAWVFTLATALYATSWVVRGIVSPDQDVLVTFVLVSLAAFCTAFFRLVFNKRFFDAAKQVESEPYIVKKSYLSQWGIVIFFSLLGFVSFLVTTEYIATADLLSTFYLSLAPLSLLYVFYEKESKQSERPDMAFA